MIWILDFQLSELKARKPSKSLARTQPRAECACLPENLCSAVVYDNDRLLLFCYLHAG